MCEPGEEVGRDLEGCVSRERKWERFGGMKEKAGETEDSVCLIFTDEIHALFSR